MDQPKEASTPPVRTELRSEFAEPAPPTKATNKDYTIPVVITVACLFLGMVVAVGVGGLMMFRVRTETLYQRATVERDLAILEAKRAEQIARQAAESAQIELRSAPQGVPVPVLGELGQEVPVFTPQPADQATAEPVRTP